MFHPGLPLGEHCYADFLFQTFGAAIPKLHVVFQEWKSLSSPIILQRGLSTYAGWGLGIWSLLVTSEAMIIKYAAHFLTQLDCFQSRVMGARYGAWSQELQIQSMCGCSIWKEIYIHAPIVTAKVKWLVRDGIFIFMSHDAWISSLSLSRWPTYMCMEVDDHLWFYDLMMDDRRSQRALDISYLFDSQLADRTPAISIPIHQNQDLRIQDRSCCLKIPIRDLTGLNKSVLERRIQVAWILKVVAYPRIRLFLWKVAWNRLPIHVLLRNKGMDILMACPICRLEDESTEHALLQCPKMRLIWRMANG